MSEVVIKPVETRRERKLFLGLPWELYREDPHWIPPLRGNQKELVGYAKHPFHEANQVQTFLAFRDGKPVGRIAGIVDKAHNALYAVQRGFFGFFESIDDGEVACGLFDAVREWLAERDIAMMRGPVNPSMNYECGLLVDGFDSPPTFMMTYNPPYYERLIKGSGFVKSQDLLAFYGHVDMLTELDEKLAYIGQAAVERFNVTTRSLDKSRFREEVDIYLKVYNESMAGTWGFVPLTPEEMKHFSVGMRQLVVPELTSIAEADGKVIATAFSLLDYNPRIKAIDGRLYPFGFLKLLRKRRDITRIRAIATTVVPEYQKWGIGLVVMQGLLPKALEWGIKDVEFSWVLESNHLSRKTLERGGAKLWKTYRLYDWEAEKSAGALS